MHEVTGSNPVTPTTPFTPVNIGRNDVCGVVVLTPRKVPSGHLVATFAGHLRFGGWESSRARKPFGQEDGRDSEGDSLDRGRKAEGASMGFFTAPYQFVISCSTNPAT